MERSLSYYINKLPMEIENEIISFLIPDKTKITFRNNNRNCEGSYYSDRYETAFIGYIIVKNKDGCYLSRIVNGKGKYRYYISKEIKTLADIECIGKRCIPIYDYNYDSKFLSKNLDHALLLLASDNIDCKMNKKLNK